MKLILIRNSLSFLVLEPKKGNRIVFYKKIKEEVIINIRWFHKDRRMWIMILMEKDFKRVLILILVMGEKRRLVITTHQGQEDKLSKIK